MTGPVPDDALPALREQAAKGRYITPNVVVRLIDEVTANRAVPAAKPLPRDRHGKYVTPPPHHQKEPS